MAGVVCGRAVSPRQNQKGENKMELYQHSVLVVTQELFSVTAGSSDYPWPDEAAKKAEWLEWRLENWTPSIPKFSIYEGLVFSMATEALRLYKASKEKGDVIFLETDCAEIPKENR